MKKLLTIVLGLTLVLGFATIVCADYKIEGKFDARLTYDGREGKGYQGLGIKDDYGVIYIDFKDSVGDNANGQIKFGFNYFQMKEGKNPYFIDLAKLDYDLTDSLSAGYQWSESYEGNPYKLYDGEDYCFDDTIGNIQFYGQDYFKSKEFGVVDASVKFDDGKFTFYSDLYPETPSYWAYGTYKVGKLTFKTWMAYDFTSSHTSDQVLTIVGSAGYKFTDRFTLTGFLGSKDNKLVEGTMAEYNIKNLVQIKGRLEYANDVTEWKNEEDALYDYNLKVTLRNMGNFRPYVEYDDDEEGVIGFDNYIGNGSKIYAEYVSKSEDSDYQDDQFILGLYFHF